MIFTKIYIDNLYSFHECEIDLSISGRSKSTIPYEYLKGCEKFRFRKVCIISGANASGKTALGRILCAIQQWYIDYCVNPKTVSSAAFNSLSETICDKNEKGTIYAEFVTYSLKQNKYFLHCITIVLSNKHFYKLLSSIPLNHDDNIISARKRLNNQLFICIKNELDNIANELDNIANEYKEEINKMKEYILSRDKNILETDDFLNDMDKLRDEIDEDIKEQIKKVRDNHKIVKNDNSIDNLLKKFEREYNDIIEMQDKFSKLSTDTVVKQFNNNIKNKEKDEEKERTIEWLYVLSDIIEQSKRTEIDRNILEKLLFDIDSSIEKVDEEKTVFSIFFNNGDSIKINKTGEINIPINNKERIWTERRLSSGTFDSLQVAILLSRIISDRQNNITNDCTTYNYFLDEKMSKVHSELEISILNLMINKLPHNAQLFYTTHNYDVVSDMNLPLYSYLFMGKEQGKTVIVQPEKNEIMKNKKNKKKLLEFLKNDFFSVLPSTKGIDELLFDEDNNDLFGE